MRVSSSNDDGLQLQAVFTAEIEQAGTRLMVSPSKARTAAGQAARPLPALIEAADAGAISTFRLEGDVNADNPDPTIFTFTADSGVLEGDRVSYKGFSYLLLDAVPQPFGTGVLGIRGVGVRTKK